MRTPAVLLAVFLTGCATMEHTTTVEVPVPVKCIIPDIPRPVLPIIGMSPDSDVFTVGRALWASVELWEAYALEMEAVNRACQ